MNMFLYQYKEMSLTRIWDNLESGNYLNKSSIYTLALGKLDCVQYWHEYYTCFDFIS